MRNSVLEINDQEYLIKLDKSEFDLSFVQSLVKRIQSEKTFFSRIWEDDGDIISKRSIQDDAGEDHLSEK
ncbi:MAG: hypothetical protein KKE39_04940 [Bacteroidetes bacterium]|nr:hypothetical protein [Bacteroidota bacterium]MBU1371273.1 hypothetical protein [Bacteroidota bacterium]MBU1485760.1 hypothetical protein [Bacteroidota bacterium]MBU1761170.1 hypothetical protein [Bacteroidota bacterium]MBU2046535.1 hypothetical protein [Bacteroidota bacterium]